MIIKNEKKKEKRKIIFMEASSANKIMIFYAMMTVKKNMITIHKVGIL
jgi:hypothetical protein